MWPEGHFSIALKVTISPERVFRDKGPFGLYQFFMTKSQRPPERHSRLVGRDGHFAREAFHGRGKGNHFNHFAEEEFDDSDENRHSRGFHLYWYSFALRQRITKSIFSLFEGKKVKNKINKSILLIFKIFSDFSL